MGVLLKCTETERRLCTGLLAGGGGSAMAGAPQGRHGPHSAPNTRHFTTNGVFWDK